MDLIEFGNLGIGDFFLCDAGVFRKLRLDNRLNDDNGVQAEMFDGSSKIG